MPTTDVVLLGLLLGPVLYGLGFWRGRRRQRASENEGEAAVRRTLTRQFRGATCHLLNNLTLL